MKRIYIVTIALSVGSMVMMNGCAIPMEPKEVSARAKLFNPPSEGNAGVYVFRDSMFGGALKKDIWIDNLCLGESAPNVFFYREVKGDVDHNISTESEFSPNDLIVKTDSGKNYFIRQYIKLGVVVGGANLQLVDEEEGKKIVSGLDMAKNGTCSQ